MRAVAAQERRGTDSCAARACGILRSVRTRDVHATAMTLALSLGLTAFSTACDRSAVSERVTAAAPAGDAALRERDAALLREIDALTARCATAWRANPECLKEACQLRAREVESFAIARAHSFTDLTESNYWHRGRLKFPGDLEQLLRRMAEETASNAPPCAPDGSASVPPARR